MWIFENLTWISEISDSEPVELQSIRIGRSAPKSLYSFRQNLEKEIELIGASTGGSNNEVQCIVDDVS